MKNAIKSLLCRYALSRIYSGEELARYVRPDILSEAAFAKGVFQYRPRPEIFGSLIRSSYDPVRFTVLAAAIQRLQDAAVPGSFAEVGVWRGDTSRIVHALAPERRYLLFDSFEGFPDDDQDARFKDTSVEYVLEKVGRSPNVSAVKGYIPGTFPPYESERFALVILDVDKYQPTRDGLEFFYPRLSPGGYIFFHDYNSPESDWGVKRAVDEFMQDRPEALLDIPDQWGSLALCKGRLKTKD